MSELDTNNDSIQLLLQLKMAEQCQKNNKSAKQTIEHLSKKNLAGYKEANDKV